MAEEKGIALAILGVVAVIAIVGLVILLSGTELTGKTSRPYGVTPKVYSSGLTPGKALGIYADGDTSDILSQDLCPGGLHLSDTRCATTPGCALLPEPGTGGCKPVGANIGVTGQVPLTQADCFALAKAYDGIVLRTLSRVNTDSRSITTINPCSGESSAGTERVFDAKEPQRDYARVQFSNGDAWGIVGGLQTGNIQYALCSAYKARIRVSGVDVCNTIG